jgi:hypothetical protein
MPEEKTHNVKTRYVKPRAYSLNRSPAMALGGCNNGLSPGEPACQTGGLFGVPPSCVNGDLITPGACKTGAAANACHTGNFAG